ncbi:MAG: molybdopterin-dependent oxidoreductase [Acidobacteriota bacterium]|nr:molybdopterin-dependent oxidoreductase [Rhodospirillaceae bacterium]MDE2881512.1 molybdopterin-dependent oxidoreductase [Acidobacteriota bacterium]MDE3262745.1 molybdopterin-dependent oxidoreductase [Acidobacteriota bacterium]
MGRYVGTSVKRVEDPRFIQGKGRYVANIQFPDMVHVAIKRSPEAHARITRIDTSAAAAMDGVVAVFTGQDFKDGGCGSLPCGWLVPDTKVPDRPIVVTDRVCHVGDSVAVVAARTPYIAADAVEAIEVDYEPLPTVVDARGAMDEGAPLVHAEIEDNVSYHWALGDQEACDKAFAEADEVVEIELVNQRLIPTAMEPRAAAAQWDAAAGEMTVWTTSQNPHPIRLLLSAFTLMIPESKLRVISPDVGGGFGSKIFHYPEEVIVPWVAREVGRPARWVATRTESQMTDSQGRDHVTVAKLAMTSDGTFTGLDVETWANQGAYLSTFAPLIPTALYITLLSGNYKMPGVFGKVHGTLTNTVPVDAYRGAGRPEAAYLVERLVDLAAARLGRDPLELRRQNAIPKEDFPYQTPVAFLYDSGDYDRLMATAADRADYAGMRESQAAARAAGKLRGVGVVCCIEASGPAPSAVAGSLGSAVGFWESGEIRVHPTGQVSVFTGSHSHGQGHETTLAQVAADELGVPIESVEVVHGDTGRINFGMGTYGSRSACVGGSALVRSAEKVRAKVLKLGAHLLEAAEEDVVYDQEAGRVHVKGSPDRGKDFGELAFAAYTAHNMPEGMEPGLNFVSFYDPANFTFPASSHICEVEICSDSWEVRVLRYVAVDDVGKVINPMIVEGQIQGGVVQGVGQALTEIGAYSDDGQLLSGTLLEYAVPRADLLPGIEVDRIETPSPHNPLGVKGAGEMGTIAATPAVANAVLDALAPLGVTHIELPLTPERIWRAVQAAGNGA